MSRTASARPKAEARKPASKAPSIDAVAQELARTARSALEPDRDGVVKAAHIVTIRRGNVIEGHQLRLGAGGPGMTKFFSAGKYGSPDAAKRAAQKVMKELGVPKAGKRGGSVAGRLLSTSSTPAAGIRFLWSPSEVSPRLRVAATWTDRKGRPRHTSFSVDRNGLEQALDLAIAKRVSCGAPMPDRAALLKALRKVRRERAG